MDSPFSNLRIHLNMQISNPSLLKDGTSVPKWIEPTVIVDVGEWCQNIKY